MDNFSKKLRIVRDSVDFTIIQEKETTFSGVEETEELCNLFVVGLTNVYLEKKSSNSNEDAVVSEPSGLNWGNIWGKELLNAGKGERVTAYQVAEVLRNDFLDSIKMVIETDSEKAYIFKEINSAGKVVVIVNNDDIEDNLNEWKFVGKIYYLSSDIKDGIS